MTKYGVFISHKSEDWALAGRIYDYLNASGYCPFIDVESLNQGNFDKKLEQTIESTPYFLLVLSSNTFKKVTENSWVIREIRTALNSKRTILILATEDFKWPKGALPSDIESIKSKNIYKIGRHNFTQIMNKLIDKDIDFKQIKGVLDWKQKAKFLSKTYLSSRENIENSIDTLETRFGAELVECARKGIPFSGENRIKSIHISCYAATIIFTPQINMVDERAFDRGVFFNIFAELLKDDEFSLEIIINAPNCMAAKEAAESEKLGNGRLEEHPEAIFLSSYCTIRRLIKDDPVFAKAKREHRFNFMITDMALPYAIFQTNYKSEYSNYDNIKVDIYSEGLTSNMDRRCMLLFKETDPENYSFFENRYQYIRNIKHSNHLIEKNHAIWVEEWEQLKKQIDYED